MSKNKWNKKSLVISSVLTASTIFAIPFVTSIVNDIRHSISRSNYESQELDYRTTRGVTDINRLMNSTVINRNTATSLDTLNTKGSLIPINQQNLSNLYVMDVSPSNINKFVKLNTSNLPKQAQITYIIGLNPATDFGYSYYGQSSKTISSVYSDYAMAGKLWVTAYTNMYYQNGTIIYSPLALDTISIEGFSTFNLANGVPAGKENIIPWTFGLNTNTVRSSGDVKGAYETTVDYFINNGESNNLFISNPAVTSTISNNYVMPLTLLTENGNPNAIKQVWASATGVFTGLGNLDFRFISKGNPGSSNESKNMISGFAYQNPLLNLKESLYSEVMKEDYYPSQLDNVSVSRYISPDYQGFNFDTMRFNIQWVNDMTGEMEVKVIGTSVQDNGAVVTQTIIINGMKSWIPLIIAIATAVAGIIFLILAFLLVNQTSKNKKYKLIRKTL